MLYRSRNSRSLAKNVWVGRAVESWSDVPRNPTGFSRGSINMAFRKRLLGLLLEAEDEARRLGPDPAYRLIEDDALREIQRVWAFDWADWEHSAVEIARPYRGDAWAPPLHPRLAPRRHLPGVPSTPCRKLLIQDAAHDVDLPPLLLWRLADILERFRDDPTYRGFVAANGRMAALLDSDWRSDGVIVSDLLWEHAVELAGEEDRRLQAEERARLAARAAQPAFVELEPPAPPPTQADTIVAEILDVLKRDAAANVWERVARAPRHGTAPRKRARHVEDDGAGAIVWDVARWFDHPTGRKDTFFCRDGSYGYVSEIYGNMQGKARHWVSYPPARDYVGVDHPPTHVVLGKRAAKYQALAYMDGRWRRVVFDQRELCWRYVDARGAHQGHATWHAEPLKTAAHAALRLERPLDDDPWLEALDSMTPRRSLHDPERSER